MSVILTLIGVGCLGLAAYAWFFMISDIQLGIVVTAAIGGFVLIGLAQVAERLSVLADKMDR